MFCKKNGGYGGYIAIIIGVLVAFYVANKSHAENFAQNTSDAIQSHTNTLITAKQDND